jgi:murein DD-endopeptidase MepM/ murein hydrolase activator NlpD
MSTEKYKFDPEKLSYKQVNKGFKYHIIRVVGWIGAAVILGIIVAALYSLVFDTPRERQLRQENRSLYQDLSKLNERYQRIDTVMRELSYIDKNIYKTIFETEPVDLTDSARTSRLELLKLLSEDNETIVNVSVKNINKVLEGIKEYSGAYIQLRQNALELGDNLQNIPAIQPIENADLTRLASGFGSRMHPFYKIIKFHSGMDFTAPTGTEVYATANGTVIEITNTGRGHGNTIIIDHGNGYKTIYSHLNKFNVRRGNKVKRGDVIGWVGNTGLSVAPHLHYEVHLHDNPVNPVNFFFLELSPQEFNKMVEMSIKSGQSFD